jgi:cyclopropane-fatty-acyl-phospholipid synthase
MREGGSTSMQESSHAGFAASLEAAGTAKSWLDRRAERLLEAALGRLADGEITVHEGGRARRFGRPGADQLRAEVEILDPRFWRQAALGGSLGVAEAFLDGRWRTDDLVSVLRVVVRNRDALLALESGFTWLLGPLERLRHARRDNSRRGSRRNILAHYDLGNELFATFLDPSLMYSAAIFERPHASLEEAQRAKLDRLCQKLQLRPGERVLEIGTGWGGFAEHAARHYGVEVVTTTISPAQHAFARERLARAGVADRVVVLDRDYRDLPAWLAAPPPAAGGADPRFDAVVSIEMIEAVGHRHLDAFFGVMSSLLRPDGRAALQAITLRDAYYERALRSVDFIQRYIFPGSFIPAVSALMASVARVTDLALVHLEDIGPHYATTLRHWRERLLAARERVLAMGYDETFLRLFTFYFAYCEAGFAERSIGDAQLILAKPGARLDALLGPIRAVPAPGAGETGGSHTPATDSAELRG